MKCNKPNSDLFSYAEGLLSEEEASAVAKHLEGCESCRKLYEQITGVLSVIDEQKAVAENPFFFTRVEARMLRPEPVQIFAVRRLVPTMVALLFFAGGVFAGINIGGLYGNDSESSQALVYETKQFLDDFNGEPIEAYIINLNPENDDTK
jgi:anti-sigma factor RsiW